jgi:hypothetical protein
MNGATGTIIFVVQVRGILMFIIQAAKFISFFSVFVSVCLLE